MSHVIWSVIVGFLAGLIARMVLPGTDHMGVIATTIVGIVGSVIGGFIGNLIKRPEPGAKFHPASFLMSIVGAIVLLLLLRLGRERLSVARGSCRRPVPGRPPLLARPQRCVRRASSRELDLPHDFRRRTNVRPLTRATARRPVEAGAACATRSDAIR